jgi:predicted ATP-grasp superfamily ATP-dependent carboligase
MHDASIEALRLRRSEVEQKSCLALANNAALDVATDKVRTLAVARQLGIPVPTGVTVHEFTELSDARRHFAFPVVVKPATSWAAASPRQGRLASQVVITDAELDKAVAKVLEAGTSAVLQQWVSGRREAVMLLNAGARICASFAQAAYRMYPALGGSSILRESIPVPPDIGEMAQRLVEEIGLDGYSEVEFRRDASGRPLLMEVNPRLSASVEVAVRAGVDFPRLIYSWAVGDRLEAADHYRVGVRMRWLGGDLLYLRQALREQGRPDVPSLRSALSAFLVDTFRPSAYDYFDLRDPLPATAAVMGLVRAAASKRRKTSSVRSPAKVCNDDYACSDDRSGSGYPSPHI